MARGLRRVWPDAEIISLPIADGGEGTLDTLLATTHGQRMPATVTGPLGTPIDAAWGLLGNGETAVVELAQAAGLTLVPPELRDPKVTTTRGVGELIGLAISHPGVRRLLVGLGGSATNDGGAGILQALGVSLRDGAGREVMAGGAGLTHIRSLTPLPPLSQAKEGESEITTLVSLPAQTKLRQPPMPTVPDSPLSLAREGQGVSDRVIEGELNATHSSSLTLQIACDVENPLTGPNGASAIFGPQKGATPDDIALLDNALAHYAEVLGIDPTQPGLGAAGGATAGLLYLFPEATLRPGIDLVLDAVGFNQHLMGADFVLTGEGRLDGQTLGGKALAGIGRRARERRVPVAALVGGLDAGLDLARLAYEAGIVAVQTIAPGPCSLTESMANAAEFLEAAAERMGRWMALGASFRGS